jgi:peptidoglycan/LPS O-acetylase OafA/YrhL
MTDRIEYLDGWRGLAILCVLIEHFFGVPGVSVGRFGVDLFFVLSGFLMSRILFEQRMPIAKFYRRRISRIMPALIVFLAVVVTAYNAKGHYTPAKEVIGMLTFTRTYMTPSLWTLGHGAPVSHTWSLNVEEHCYLILSLVASVAFLRRNTARVLFALALLSFVAILLHMALATPETPPFMKNTECAAAALLLSAGYRTIAPGIVVPPWAPLLAGALAAFCYADAWGWEGGGPRVVIAPFLLAFAVNHIGASYAWVVRMLEASWLRLLGVLSYSVYLWQEPFWDHQAHFPYHTAVLFAIAVGALSYYCIESPTRRWLNAHWGKAGSSSRAMSADASGA